MDVDSNTQYVCEYTKTTTDLKTIKKRLEKLLLFE